MLIRSRVCMPSVSLLISISCLIYSCDDQANIVLNRAWWSHGGRRRCSVGDGPDPTRLAMARSVHTGYQQVRADLRRIDNDITCMATGMIVRIH